MIASNTVEGVRVERQEQVRPAKVLLPAMSPPVSLKRRKTCVFWPGHLVGLPDISFLLDICARAMRLSRGIARFLEATYHSLRRARLGAN